MDAYNRAAEQIANEITVNMLSECFDKIRMSRTRLTHHAERQPEFSSEKPELRLVESIHDENNPEDAHPNYPPPLVTYILLAAITVVFIAMEVVGHGNILSVMLAFGSKDNTLIRQGQYWRLVTPIFLHGSWLHLIVNGFSLYMLGGPLERIYGSRKFLIIFLVSGIAGNLLSYALSPTPSLGASGALFGLVGAGIAFPLRFRALIAPEARTAILRQLITVAAVNLFIGFTLQGIIDNWAHIGGLLGGGFAALFLIPGVLEAEPRSPLVNALLTFAASVCVGIVLLSCVLQWRWAMQNMLPPLVGYKPAGGDDWWAVNVPARWKLQQGVWHSPEGAVLKISDSLTDPQIAAEAQDIARRQEKTNTELDGKQGWYREASTSQGVLKEYRILAYDRLFGITLTYPAPVLPPKIQRDFQIVAASARFIHPPVSPFVPNPAP